MRIPIIYEDKDLLIINKPAGLLIHPSTLLRTGPRYSNSSKTIPKERALTDWLTEKYPDIKKVGENLLRPGIVHRLDKDTSGLIIIAKNNRAFFYLKEQFQKREIIKKYLALVIGKLKDKKGIIDKAIGRSRKKGIKQTVSPIVPRKEAITKYRVIKEYQDYSLIEAIPKTGRMHQIRVHMSSIGHPVAGDKQYKFKRQPCPKGLNRHFLHAIYLKFQLLSGEIKEFESELPNDLKTVLEKLI